METGIIEGVTEVIESKTEAICDRSALPDGTALENGRYEIRTTLGNGGFGITYKAWDYRLQRFVAIKEFFPDGFAYRDAGQSREVRCIQDAQTFQHGKHRFQKEAQLLAKLDFSHIVRVHDSFEENNTVYIVMEYINGETLNRYVRRTGPIAASYLRELFLPLLRDLDAIHRAGMIHRDISPDNIMVTAEDGQLKLIDFGTAKDLTRSNERTIGYSVSQSVVRMNYSPIEMFSTVEKKPSADVYSLCATMYFCLTGEEPPSALDRAFDDTLPPGLRGLDRNTEKVILKGMSLKPEGRYASAEELMQALGGQTKERKPQQEQKNQKGTLKWLPAVLGCIAAIAVLVLIPVALLTGREEQSGNAKSSQQLIAVPTIKNTQTENTKQEETPEETSKTPEDTAPQETDTLQADTLQAAADAAESAFGEPVSGIRLYGPSSMDIYSYRTAVAQIEPRAQALTGGKYRIWTDSTGFNTYVLLPNSLLGQEEPARFLRETSIVLRVSGETYFYAGVDNYKRLEPSDIVDASLQKDAQGQDEIYIRLTDKAAERVSSVFDNAQDKTVCLYMDVSLSADGKYLARGDGYSNLFRDEDDPAVFHCYGNYNIIGDAQVKIAQTFLDIMKADNTGGALNSALIYRPVWETAADSGAGAYQAAELDVPAIRAMYSFNSSGGKEDPESRESAIRELKKRLDLLHVPYVFGQAAIDDEIIFVEVPQSEVPYEALDLLLGSDMGISVGTPFWNTNFCDYSVLPDGGILAEIHKWADEDVEPGLAELINGTVDSQTVYLFISCVAEDRKVLQAELTTYPGDRKIKFRKLLLQNSDGTWDGSGFMELLGYIAEHGEVDSAVTQFVLTNVTFVNGAEDGYLVYSELEEQERLQRALIEDYPDVQVEIDSSIPPQLKIHFNFSVDEQLPAKALEAAQRVYELVKDGSTDTVRLIFTEEKNTERCRAVFTVDSFFTHRMKLLLFSFTGGRLERYEEDFQSLYASSAFIQSLESGTDGTETS